MTRDPSRRPAYEPVERLLRPTPYDPGMKRPGTTVAGTLLVLLGAIVDVLTMIDLAVNWREYAGSFDIDLDGLPLTPGLLDMSLAVVLILAGAVVVVQLACAVLIFLGNNAARVLVMSVVVLSVFTAFVSWWAQDQAVTLRTTLPGLAVDILVLLALSSRSAAAYARRNEKH